MPILNSILIGLATTSIGVALGRIQVTSTFEALWFGAMGAVGALTARMLWALTKTIITKLKNKKNN